MANNLGATNEEVIISDEYPMEICSGLRSTQRMVRAITAPPEPPVTFKGFSGSLMVFSDSPLLAENHKPEPQSKEVDNG